MKLTILLFLWGLISVSASTYSQVTKLTMSLESVSILEVLERIESQTDFVFLYRNDVIDQNKRLNIKVEGSTIEEILNEVLKNTGIRYEIIKKQIILTPERTVLKARPAPTSDKSAQAPKRQINLTGKVKDDKGVPIPGATIVIKGTTVGTISDQDGSFSLSVPQESKTLVVSFVGYQSQELTLGFQTDLMITLKEVNFGVDEVVVVGYGVQKKVAITAAVSSVGSEEIMKSSSADLTNALSGKLTGLSALQNGGGQPGKDDATIYLRGISTLNGASPLVLIDGVPRDNMRAIDANEVESVSILKDASATAVFGVRGANGVIMITTKRGKEGKAQLGINIEQNFTSFTREPKRIHSVEYMQLRNLALTNDGLPAAFSEETIAKFRDPLAGLDKNAPDYEEQKALRNYIYCDHDYYREFIKRYTPQTRASVDVSGGTKDISYFLNAGFLHQGGNLNSRPKSELGFDPASYMNRFTFRSNLDYKVTNSLSLFLNLGTYIERVNMPLGNPIVTFIVETIQLSPITPGPKSIDGYGVPGGIIVHPGQNHDVAPYEVLNGRGYQMDCRSNLNSTFGGVWDLSNAITPGLSLKGMVSYDSYQGSTIWGSTSFPTVYSHIDYDTDNLIFSYKSDVGSPLSIGKSMLTSYNVNMQGSLNYNRRFNKHEVTGLLLCQRDFWDAGAEIPHNVIGFVGRMLYNYDNKYFAEYDIGYNGSEQFGPGHRFGFFPAVSAGWVVSNENFLKDSRVINNLKLRLSYGKVGNDRISSDRFLYLDNITLGNGFLGSLGNGQQVNEGLVGNPNISWEIAKKKNMGVDFVLFKNLSGTFDLFDERRSDILVQRSSVPAFQGVDPGYALSGKIPKANMGVVHNRGFEAELDYSLPVTKDLSFRFRGNFSYAHNTIKESDEVPLDETYVCRYRRMGNPVGQEFGFLIDWDDHGGYWISQDQINSSGLKYEFGQPRVGDFKYIDKNEDGVINDKDQVPVGYSSVVPEILYGFSLGAKYKNFDFSVFFQGVGRYSKYLNFQNVWECFGDGTYYDYHMNSWTLDRYLNGSKITHPALSTKENTNHVKNDFFIMSCAYTRLKDIELGYTLPKASLSFMGVNELRVSLGGHNLWLWDHLKMKHLDPENDSPLGYPTTKMVKLGLKVTF